MSIRLCMVTVSLYLVPFHLSLLTQADETKPLIPSQNLKITCPEYQGCLGTTCEFTRETLKTKSEHFKTGETLMIKEDEHSIFSIGFPATREPKFDGILTYAFSRYDNGIEQDFSVAEVTLNKPYDVEGSQVICTSDFGDCKLQSETASQLIFVAGLPSDCTPSAPPTTPPDENLLLPSNNPLVKCPGHNDCAGDNCHFERSLAETTDKPFLPNETMFITCDSLKVLVFFPSTRESNYQGKKSYTCFQYANKDGTSFPVAEVTLTKPDDVKGSQVLCSFYGSKCTFDISSCTLQKETDNQVVLVAGFPSTCSLATSPPDTVFWLPSQNSLVDCPGHDACAGDTCHFQRTKDAETMVKRFLPNDTSLAFCGPLIIFATFPATSQSGYIGKNTYTCYQYVNNGGKVFSAAEVTLTKPDDVKGSQVVCTFDRKKCTLDGSSCTVGDETDNQVVLVAGVPRSCSPITPPPAETAAGEPASTDQQ